MDEHLTPREVAAVAIFAVAVLVFALVSAPYGLVPR